MATVNTTVSRNVGPIDHGRAVTAEEYLQLEVEPGYQCELARGVLEVIYIPGRAHALLVYLFYKWLGRYDDAHPGVIEMFGGSNEFHFWLPDLLSGRNPDVVVELRGAMRNDHGDRLASLAIEVVSPGKEAHNRDYVAKREEYLLYGLREYWIVDRFARTTTVLIREGESRSQRVFKDDESAEGIVLPGFVVPLAELWAVVPDED